MEKSNIKIIFFGTSEFAVPALKYLIQNGYDIIAAVTQPEKPAGRARITMPSPIKKVALESHIPAFEPHNLKDEDFFKQFKRLAPDIAVVASYGKIIPKNYLEIPKYGFLNIHPSLLPKYRGPSPIQTAILNGDPVPILSTDRHSEKVRDWCGAGKETGVTIMLMDDKIDHGPILSSKSYCLLPTTYYTQAEKELAELGGELLLEVLQKYIAGEIKPKEQDHSQATFTKMLTREDGKISWHRSAQEIYNQVHALNPEPGTWTTWKSNVFNITEVQPRYTEVEPRYSPGIVVDIGNNIAVATKKCYLILKQIQLEGGKVMDVRSFVNGHPDFLNSQLG